jgi:hypothetical protein
MQFQVVYALFWLIFVIVLFLFNRFKLYSREKWKVTISLFIGLNALFTGFVLYQQNVIHQEDITNKVTDKYDQISESLYAIPLDYILKTPSLRHLINDMFMNETKKTDEVYNDELYHYEPSQKIIYEKQHPEETALFLKICQEISVYAQYYYLHLPFPEYREIIKQTNNRFVNLLSGYLKYKPFRDVVQYFINYQAGHRSQKYMKEFFNISSTNPNDKTEILISKNKIINGKINGVTDIH